MICVSSSEIKRVQLLVLVRHNLFLLIPVNLLVWCICTCVFFLMFTLVLLVAVTHAHELVVVEIEPGSMPPLPRHLACGKCLNFLKFSALKTSGDSEWSCIYAIQTFEIIDISEIHVWNQTQLIIQLNFTLNRKCAYVHHIILWKRQNNTRSFARAYKYSGPNI